MDAPPQYRPSQRTFAVDDLDTASIQSAAPSYVSAAPTYVSTLPLAADTDPDVDDHARAPRQPSLDHFKCTWSTVNADPARARHYHSVAQRRASAASAREERERHVATLHPQSMAYKTVVERMEAAADDDSAAPYTGMGRKDYLPLEDPSLVGDEAAAQARQERLAREQGDAVLLREDRRWDWLLAQMQDWDERERSWTKFRNELAHGRRGKLARRLGLR